MRSHPRGRELKKSRRNRGALHGDSYGGEADVFANYALPLHLYCDSLLLPFPAFNLLPTVLTDRYDGFRQVGLLVPGIDGEVKDRSAHRPNGQLHRGATTGRSCRYRSRTLSWLRNTPPFLDCRVCQPTVDHPTNNLSYLAALLHVTTPSGEFADQKFLGQTCANPLSRADRKIAEEQPSTTIGLGIVKVRKSR